MSDETTLLPCPFCGGEAETWNGAGPWHVVCTKCGTVGSPCLTEAEAIAAWNTRAELGSGTCKITATATNNLMYPDYMTKWYELSCGHSLTLKGDEAPKWCAVCGKAVER